MLIDGVNVDYPDNVQTGIYVRYYASNNALIDTDYYSFATGNYGGELYFVTFGPYSPVAYWCV